MTTEAEQRAAVISEARSWIGTPFRDNAAIKGAGVDCAQLCARVYAAAGIMDAFPVPHYSPQWFLHRDEEVFLDNVLTVAREVAEHDVRPGDMALFKIGRLFAHGSIVVGWPDRIIHAHKQSGMVLESRAFDGDLWGRPVRWFSPWR